MKAEYTTPPWNSVTISDVILCPHFSKIGMWLEFRKAERDALIRVINGAELSKVDLDALSDLTLMGVVTKADGEYLVGSRLFSDWLRLYVY